LLTNKITSNQNQLNSSIAHQMNQKQTDKVWNSLMWKKLKLKKA
jgi:hypothetical protein